jgi:hypothetical protein
MALSGAGSAKHSKTDPVERTYKRELRPVGPDYEQDIIPYQEGFWAQYKWRVVFSSLGFLAAVALWVAYFFLPQSRFDTYAMGPIMAFLLFLTPVMGALPIWYYVRYRRTQRVLEYSLDDDDIPEEVKVAFEFEEEREEVEVDLFSTIEEKSSR